MNQIEPRDIAIAFSFPAARFKLYEKTDVCQHLCESIQMNPGH